MYIFKRLTARGSEVSPARLLRCCNNVVPNMEFSLRKPTNSKCHLMDQMGVYRNETCLACAIHDRLIIFSAHVIIRVICLATACPNRPVRPVACACMYCMCAQIPYLHTCTSHDRRHTYMCHMCMCMHVKQGDRS